MAEDAGLFDDVGKIVKTGRESHAQKGGNEANAEVAFTRDEKGKTEVESVCLLRRHFAHTKNRLSSCFILSLLMWGPISAHGRTCCCAHKIG